MNDVWFSGDGVRWRQAAAHAPWTPRGAEHSAVFNNRLWIYGGKTGRAEVENGFGGDAWHLAPAGRGPSDE